MSDPDLARLFRNCFPNTLDTTVGFYDRDQPSTFIITGDISAMWLRDSTNQVLPYLPFVTDDPELENMICGVVLRQAEYVSTDSYANAFNLEVNGNGHQDDTRVPKMTRMVFEGKYELDSLAAFLKLSYGLYNASESSQCMMKKTDLWLNAVRRVFETIKEQQAGSLEELPNPPYQFMRNTEIATDTLMIAGKGVPAKRIGMSKSHFRPSDDASTLPFPIGANAMAVIELRHVAEILKSDDFQELKEAKSLSVDMENLAAEIERAIYELGVISRNGKRFFAYEIDGYGSQYFMDDANIPSLLSLPYLGFIEKNDPLYLETRSRILSSENPYFFKGSAGEGVGGPHIGLGYIWPMSVITRALTSQDDAEIMDCLEILKRSSTSIGIPYMHESFWKDDPSKFTRPWFAWANTLFGELILTLKKERPHLIFSDSY
jgi:meiotically up-regulated gene 157 (Mug157) protein